MATCRGCDATWTAIAAAHCSSCHATFSTVGNFDRHRRSFECHPPGERGLVLNKRGHWGMPGRDEGDETA